jgi:hypothetical protein
MELNHLIQVVYFSDRAEGPAAGTAGDICTRIERENVARGITGFIFAIGGCFVSVLEGGHDDILARMEQIAADPSHQRMVVLRESAIDARRFASWKSGSFGTEGAVDYDRSDAQAFAARLSKGMRMVTPRPA